MTALATALRQELETIDIIITDATKRRDAIMTLLPPEIVAEAKVVKPIVAKASKAKLPTKPKATRPSLRSDISVETIHDVRNLAREGYTHNQIAEIHDLGRSTVSNIVGGKSWFGSVE